MHVICAHARQQSMHGCLGIVFACVPIVQEHTHVLWAVGPVAYIVLGMQALQLLLVPGVAGCYPGQTTARTSGWLPMIFVNMLGVVAIFMR
jgi:hypothetical protein